MPSLPSLKASRSLRSDAPTSDAYAFEVFRKARRDVPAYRHFLAQAGFKLKQPLEKHFTALPITNKENYLRAYPLDLLVHKGSLDGSVAFSATSGSTGAPFYFPRNEILESQSAAYHELFLQCADDLAAPALVIIGFGMGVWIGGMLTYSAFSRLGNAGYPVSIVTAGSNRKEILEAVRHVGKQFKRVILCGYPPFLKDVLDHGIEEGIHWSEYNVRIIFAAEAFSERFRDRVAAMAGIQDPYAHITNIYGTADLGTMALETPLTIWLRRRSLEQPELYRALFGDAGRLPTLAQFNPSFIHFEAPEGKILVTGDSVLPLVRYEIGDRGGVISYERALELLARHGGDKATQLLPGEIALDRVPHWPLVYVYERTDFSTKLYGAIIYPEHIRESLLAPHPATFLTGRFTAATEHDDDENEFLAIHLELQEGIDAPPDAHAFVKAEIIRHLLEKNAEYHYLFGLMQARVEPRLTFWEYGHPQYFHHEGKQKWIKKT